MAVMAKAPRQPMITSAIAISGTPTTWENFAVPSKSAVARLRSWRGNQCPTAFEFNGKLGASAIPSSMRATKIPP
jgi:hypothetical protein